MTTMHILPLQAAAEQRAAVYASVYINNVIYIL